MRFISYLKHVHAELQHVVWPDTQTALGHTLILIAIATLVAVFIGLLDYGFTQLLGEFVTSY